MRKLADGGERSGFFSIQRYLRALKVLDLPETEVPRPELLAVSARQPWQPRMSACGGYLWTNVSQQGSLLEG